MITNGKQNFLTAHYDWLVVGVGALALLAGLAYFVMQLGVEAEADAQAAAQRIERMKPQETGVKSVEMKDFTAAVGAAKKPVTITEIDGKKASYLASEMRVKCKKCEHAIPGDIKVCPKCPVCGEAQEVPVEVVLDADNDGLPDAWETLNGLNPKDPTDAAKDADGDGFTNIEEYQAKTDPRNKTDHPPYVDSLKIQLPLKETHLPFVFRSASKIPSGYRLAFFDSTAESLSNRNKKGATVTAVVGEEIGKTGYIAKSYEQKTEKRERKGMSGKVDVDVSEVTVERKSDGKVVKLVVQPKGLKFAAVDVQATLVYERNGVKNFDVVPGTVLDLNGQKFKVVNVVAEGKGAKVELEDPLTAKRHTLKAQE